MDNEIKEILAYFEEYIKITDMHDSEPMLNWKDLKIVLDYITNLQEENENLKDYLKIMEKGKDNNLNRFLDYKSRNEKTIEYSNNCLENIEEYDEYICESIDIVSLLRMIHKNYIYILQGEDKE